MIIYTCPECGHDLLSEVLTCMPPIHRDYCPSCGWSHSKREKIERIPFPSEENAINIIEVKSININGEDYLTTAINRSECKW